MGKSFKRSYTHLSVTTKQWKRKKNQQNQETKKNEKKEKIIDKRIKMNLINNNYNLIADKKRNKDAKK